MRRETPWCISLHQGVAAHGAQVDDRPPVPAGRHQPGRPQHVQMLGHRTGRDAQAAGELAGRGRGGEQLEQFGPRPSDQRGDRIRCGRPGLPHGGDAAGRVADDPGPGRARLGPRVRPGEHARRQDQPVPGHIHRGEPIRAPAGLQNQLPVGPVDVAVQPGEHGFAALRGEGCRPHRDVGLEQPHDPWPVGRDQRLVHRPDCRDQTRQPGPRRGLQFLQRRRQRCPAVLQITLYLRRRGRPQPPQFGVQVGHPIVGDRHQVARLGLVVEQAEQQLQVGQPAQSRFGPGQPGLVHRVGARAAQRVDGQNRLEHRRDREPYAGQRRAGQPDPDHHGV